MDDHFYVARLFLPRKSPALDPSQVPSLACGPIYVLISVLNFSTFRSLAPSPETGAKKAHFSLSSLSYEHKAQFRQSLQQLVRVIQGA